MSHDEVLEAEASHFWTHQLHNNNGNEIPAESLVQQLRRSNKTTSSWACTLCPEGRVFASNQALQEHVQLHEVNLDSPKPGTRVHDWFQNANVLQSMNPVIHAHFSPQPTPSGQCDESRDFDADAHLRLDSGHELSHSAFSPLNSVNAEDPNIQSLWKQTQTLLYQYAPTPIHSPQLALSFELDAKLTKTFDELIETLPVHAQVESEPNTCQQCHQRFRMKARLDTHASQTKHLPYACLCGERFSRFDVLSRHIDKFFPRELYPCPYCSKYTSFKAFHRQDHLAQHLRNDHKIDLSEGHDVGEFEALSPLPKRARKNRAQVIIACPHEGCLYHRQPTVQRGATFQRIFQNRRDLTKHIRDEHDESPFPCNKPGCQKVRGQGYFRERDLIKHQQRDHKEP